MLFDKEEEIKGVEKQHKNEDKSIDRIQRILLLIGIHCKFISPLYCFI